MEKKEVGLIIGIIIVSIALVYLLFFHVKNCNTLGCFNENLVKCNSARYVREAKDASWLYEIEGKEGDKCEVRVELLQMKRGSADLVDLEGKSMNCYLPEKTIVTPENNLNRCHGQLKEEMQEEIINKLHSYILDNLDEVKEGLKEPISE